MNQGCSRNARELREKEREQKSEEEIEAAAGVAMLGADGEAGHAETEKQKMNQIDAVGKAAISRKKTIGENGSKARGAPIDTREANQHKRTRARKTERGHPEGIHGEQPLCEDGQAREQNARMT